MDPRFAHIVDHLAPQLERLLEMKTSRYGELPPEMPKAGAYLFSEGKVHLYAGRSNDLRKTHGHHCGPGATWREATFAFLLARQQTGNLRATYDPGSHSRKGLLLSADFKKAFEDGKSRIRQMDYRYVEEIDQNRRALLEIYCAIVLQTQFNDIRAH